MAEGRSAVWTVTTLMICPAVCALTTLAALLDAACPAATANSAGSGRHLASRKPDWLLPATACYLPAPFEQPDSVVQRALGQPGVGGPEFFEGA